MTEGPGSGKRSMDALVSLMARLRGEDGCPWDREQTPTTLKPYILEEAYEVIAAIEKEEWSELCSELGDLLLQVVFQARIAEEQKLFDMGDVIEGVIDKMTRRHPHVFGGAAAENAAAVLDNWEKIKRAETPGRSVTEGIDLRLPALLRAQRIQDKVARVGFDWESAEGALRKVQEEFEEVREALDGQIAERIEEELGDLLFAVVNVARLAGFNGEEALRKANLKFEERFRKVEEELRTRGLSPERASLEEMESIWQAAKKDD